MLTTMTEGDINQILRLAINDYVTIKRDKKFYLNLLELFDDKLSETYDVPLLVKSKYELAKNILTSLAKGNTTDYAIYNCITVSEKFKQHKDIVDVFKTEVIPDNVIQEVLKMIDLRLREKALFLGAKIYKEYYEFAKDGIGYDTVEDAWLGFNELVDNLYGLRKDVKQKELINNDSSVMLGDKDESDKEHMQRVYNKLVLRYDRYNKIPSGLTFLDNLLEGGFEKGGLYIIAGQPSAGKSTWLLNLAKNAAYYSDYKGKLKDQLKLFVYLSLENPEITTLTRLDCIIEKVNKQTSVNTQLKMGFDEWYNRMKTKRARKNSRLLLEYKQNKSISIFEIESVIDTFLEDHKDQDAVLGGIYIDYLELLKPNNTRGKDVRFDFADIAGYLKTLADDYQCPVVTATQLNRDSFDIKNAKDLSMKHGAESMYPQRIADFYMCIAKHPEDKNKIFFKVVKNRDGEAGVYGELDVDYSKFLIFDKLEGVLPIECDYKNSNEMLRKSPFQWDDKNCI